MTRRGIIGLLAGATAAALTGCGLFDTRASYRFRMTVEVATPQGIRRGSSVYELKAVKNGTKLLAEERAGGTVTFGEAVVIDMPDGHPLFVMMEVPTAGENLGGVATRALAPSKPLGGIDNFIAAVREVARLPIGTSAFIPQNDWPIMVRFADIKDPNTVEQVDASSMGVKKITVEVSNDDLSRGIEKKFPPWFAICRDKKRLLDGSDASIISSDKLSGKLGFGDFSNIPEGVR